MPGGFRLACPSSQTTRNHRVRSGTLRMGVDATDWNLTSSEAQIIGALMVHVIATNNQGSSSVSMTNCPEMISME